MSPLYKVAVCCVAFVLAGSWCVAHPSLENHLSVEWNVPVTGLQGGHLLLYEMKADPEDGSNLIICGARRDARDNAYYGVVYFSSDGGRSWRTALEDRNGMWVSEQSCSFGQKHMAYFVSQATQVLDVKKGDEVETTRVFVSSDAGRTWAEEARTGPADYSNAVVGRVPGGDSQQLYVFYNGSTSHNTQGKPASTLNYFTVSEDGTKISERQSVPGMTEREYHGVYPSSSVVLNDGTPVVLFVAGKQLADTRGITHLEIGVVRFTSNGPSGSTVVATPSARNVPPGILCPASLSSSLAYDKLREILYVAYNDVASGHCAAMLSVSRDGGRTWLPPRELTTGRSQSAMYFPVLAVNQSGAIGMLWRGKAEHSPDCWSFSVSRDGVRFGDSVLLSRCVSEDGLKEQSSGYLNAVIEQAEGGGAASVEMLSRRDDLIRIGITSTTDGVFHPLWSTSGEDSGELRTARIWADEKPSPPPQLMQAFALNDVTDKITVLYGGEQRLDHETNSVTLDLSFRNDTSDSLAGPFYLRVENATSDFGKVRLVNSPVASMGTDYLDLSSVLRNGSLAAGQTTEPYRLAFHLEEEKSAAPANKNYIVRMKLKLFRRENP